MSITPTDERIRHQRTHERLRRDITTDPIFLLQQRRWWYAVGNYEWDSDLERFLDKDGDEVSRERLEDEGQAGTYWDTVSVFLTREDGEEHGSATAYRYPDGWRVYCVHASGDLVHVLGDATVGGRYR